MGSARIHGEIKRLGLEVSERTVSRYMPRRPAHPDARQRWRSFLANYREVIAAMGLFTVPTVTFRVLYVFFVVHHARCTLIHVRVTGHPTAAWSTQQLAVTRALVESIARREQKRLRELFGRFEWNPNFDYKAERSRS